MISTTWISTYGNTYFGVASAGAAAASLLIFLAAFGIVCILAKRTPSTITDCTALGCLCMGFVAFLLVVAQILWALAAAGLSGVGLAGTSSTGGLFVLASIPLLFVVPFVVAALSPRLWKGHYNASHHGTCKCHCCGIVGFVIAASFRAVGVKPVLVWSLVVSALTATALAFLGLQGLCYCSNPSQVSSWASRRVDVPICVEGTICHSYFLLGETPDTLTLVLQWVDGPEAAAVAAAAAEQLSQQRSVGRVEVRYCEVDVPHGNCSTSVEVTAPSSDCKFFPYHYLSEDRRYVAHVTLRGLKGSQGYRVQARLLDASSPTSTTLAFPLATATLYPRTVPSSTSLDPLVNNNITFVGGGDYYMGQVGIETLMAALQATPDAQFIFLGGDLSYANNMRTCYRRWDQFFVEMTRARTNARGWHLPLAHLPGNHESGRYAESSDSSVEGDASGSGERVHFYPQFFPGSPSSFYHSHLVGDQLGLIMLDSGCFTRTADQVSFLETTLKNWTTRGLLPAPQKNVFPVPMFHVPAFPGRDHPSSSDAPSREGARRNFVPLFHRYNVSVAFHYHEHVYFRSKELDAAGNVLLPASTTSPAGQQQERGVVYLGDGAMGVAGLDRIAMASGTSYSAVTFSEINFAYSATFVPSPSLSSSVPAMFYVKAISPTGVDLKTSAVLGKVIDSVEIQSRV